MALTPDEGSVSFEFRSTPPRKDKARSLCRTFLVGERSAALPTTDLNRVGRCGINWFELVGGATDHTRNYANLFAQRGPRIQQRSRQIRRYYACILTALAVFTKGSWNCDLVVPCALHSPQSRSHRRPAAGTMIANSPWAWGHSQHMHRR
jgi:hypothetical protein